MALLINLVRLFPASIPPFNFACAEPWTGRMKASVRSVHRGFQSYLRATITDPTVHPLRRTICTDCLNSLRHQSRLCAPSRRQLHILNQRQNPTSAALREAVQIASSGQRYERRELATVNEVTDRGPLEEYDDRVHSRKLREDEHQRSEGHPHDCSEKNRAC